MKEVLAKGKFSFYLPLCFVVLFFTGSVRAEQNGSLTLLWPALQASGEALEQNAQQADQPFLKRVGQVYLGALDTFQQELMALGTRSKESTSFRGMQLSMSFFPEREITVIVDSESRSATDAISLGGRQLEHDISTFSMTITAETYLITYQDMDNALTYRVVGNMESGIGKVIEIDLKKLPPMYDADPVIPPTD